MLAAYKQVRRACAMLAAYKQVRGACDMLAYKQVGGGLGHARRLQAGEGLVTCPLPTSRRGACDMLAPYK